MTVAGNRPRRAGAWAWVLLAGVLAGCTGEDMSDLKTYVNKVESRKGGRIKPLPEFKTYENYAYVPAERRDPFEPVRDVTAPEQAGQAGGSGIQPDFDRRRETLESFPLDALEFVGHLQRKDDEWALIAAPDGLVHRVQAGNYLGQNHGKIEVVTESKILLTEIVPDGTGGWIEREAALALNE